MDAGWAEWQGSAKKVGGLDDLAAPAASHFPVPDRCGSLKLGRGMEDSATIVRIALRLFGMENFDAWIIFW